MRIAKHLAVWAALAALTAVLVVMPPYLSERQTAALADAQTSWSYDGNPTATPDSATVARQYAAGGIDMIASPFADSGYTSMDAHDSAMLMMDAVFGDRALHHRLDHFSVMDILSFDHRVGIVMQDGRPTVLNFISVELQYTDTTVVQMLFEEKTDTLLSLSVSCKTANDEEVQWIENDLYASLNTYYRETLALAENETVLVVERTEEELCLFGDILQAENDPYAYVTDKEFVEP